MADHHQANTAMNISRQSQNSDRSVILKPFPHQVGGHNCILMYDPWTVCKPLSNGELLFYHKQLPHSLRQYIPKYLGMLENCVIIFRHVTDSVYHY